MRDMYKAVMFIFIVSACCLYETSTLRGEKSDDFKTGEIVGANAIAEPSKAVIEGINKIQSIKESVSRAQSYIEKGFQQEEQLHSVGDIHGKENFLLARKCFSRADDLLKKDEVSLFLKWGWVMYKTHGDKRDKKKAVGMLENALALDPDNPEACYKVAYVKLASYYNVFSEEQHKHAITLPDGSHQVTQVQYHYSKERDNRNLDEAEQLLKKAIKLDGTFADAYWLLASKIYAHKNEPEMAIPYYRLFLKYVDSVSAELNFYNTQYIAIRVPMAKDYLSIHARDKLAETKEPPGEKAQEKQNSDVTVKPQGKNVSGNE